MNKNDLLKLAKLHCIFNAPLTKAALIRAIQNIEGSFDCFASASNCKCHGSRCDWREDCRLESTRSCQAVASCAAMASNAPSPNLQWSESP